MQNNRLHTIIDRVHPGFPQKISGSCFRKTPLFYRGIRQKEVYMERYQKFRKEFPRFYYHGYKTEETELTYKITYDFEIEGLSSFAPVWTFPKRSKDGKNWGNDSLFQEMVFSLGMVELVSYWKITCSPEVIVEAGRLNSSQILWWKDLYFNGLGEFFYVNHISEADPQDFMEIHCRSGRGTEVCCAENECAPEGFTAAGKPEIIFGQGRLSSVRGSEKGVLVPVGGGKDSAVTLELLKGLGVPVYAYIINSRGATIHTAEAAGLDESQVIYVKRTLDQNMLELNRQGYLNGHTPFSALVAFSSIMAARMAGLSYVALSNESSANESTVKGSTVNHQYSKSFKFEEDFHRYEAEYLPGSAYYFSMLRPLSEFQIARFFAGQKQYHAVFRSCNAGSKTDSWCGRCPKCLFVYLILSPFLSEEEVERIFGRNMLQDEEMKPLLDQLTGIREEKPFECVGSRDEINSAIVLTIDRMEKEGRKLPLLLDYYKGTGLYNRYQSGKDQFSAYFDSSNLVPEPWENYVRSRCTKEA